MTRPPRPATQHRSGAAASAIHTPAIHRTVKNVARRAASIAQTVTLFFRNGTQEILATQVNSSGTRATFEWQGDLAEKTPERVNISHSKADDVNNTVSSSASPVFISALLVATPLPQQQEPVALEGAASGSGAECQLWLLLFVSSFAFYRRKRFTHR